MTPRDTSPLNEIAAHLLAGEGPADALASVARRSQPPQAIVLNRMMAKVNHDQRLTTSDCFA